MLISPEQARQIVLESVPASRRAPARVPVAEAGGRVLAESIVADRDFPPFDRATMDGFAIRLADAGASVDVKGEVRAGARVDGTLSDGQAYEIMTGAPCPAGTEAVVPVEQVRRVGACEDARVALPAGVRNGQFIVPRGAECRKGTVVLDIGEVLSPMSVAVLAAVGATEVSVRSAPSLAIISTGDELTETSSAPRLEQIRDSNTPMIEAMGRASGISDCKSLRAGDREDVLGSALEQAESCDFVVLMGGVSAGKYDLVPAAIERFGGRVLFHKVAQQPGKPLLFAVRERDGGRQLIFGMPGNPLACHFCFHRYVQGAIKAWSGRGEGRTAIETGNLSSELRLSAPDGRTRFLPARVSDGRVTLLVGRGSADIFAASKMNAYVRVAPEIACLEAGAVVEFERVRGL